MFNMNIVYSSINIIIVIFVYWQ